jgi:phosphate transport system permease protein
VIILAAVPAIVHGILGLGLIARGPLSFGFTVMTASLTLSLLVLPVMIIASREAIRSIPTRSARDHWPSARPDGRPSSAKSCRPRCQAWRPAPSSRSRALGEAAPLVLLGGVSFITFNPDSPDSPYTVLPILIFSWTIRPQEEFRVAASAAIVVLLVILLAMNSLAIFLRNRYQQRW